jgi:hypothetical protein
VAKKIEAKLRGIKPKEIKVKIQFNWLVFKINFAVCDKK